MDKLIPPSETHLGDPSCSETPISYHILIDLPPTLNMSSFKPFSPPQSTLCRSLLQAKHLSPASYGRAAAVQQWCIRDQQQTRPSWKSPPDGPDGLGWIREIQFSGYPFWHVLACLGICLHLSSVIAILHTPVIFNPEPSNFSSIFHLG